MNARNREGSQKHPKNTLRFDTPDYTFIHKLTTVIPIGVDRNFATTPSYINVHFDQIKVYDAQWTLIPLVAFNDTHVKIWGSSF